METCAENSKEDDVMVDGSASNVEINDSGFQRFVSSDMACVMYGVYARMYVRNVAARAAG